MKFHTKLSEVSYGDFTFKAAAGVVDIPAEHVHAFTDLTACRWLVPVDGVAETTERAIAPKPDFVIPPDQVPAGAGDNRDGVKIETGDQSSADAAAKSALDSATTVPAATPMTASERKAAEKAAKEAAAKAAG